jgi:hypothetical protein
MAITLGSSTISGLTSGGLPSGSVTNSNIATSTITGDKLATNAKVYYTVSARNSNMSLGGDSGWNDYISFTFSSTYGGNIMVVNTNSMGWESGACYAFGRFILDGSKIGVNFLVGRQTNYNSAACGSGCWYGNVAAGTHTILLQYRNTSATWQSNMWSYDETCVNCLALAYYP